MNIKILCKWYTCLIVNYRWFRVCSNAAFSVLELHRTFSEGACNQTEMKAVLVIERIRRKCRILYYISHWYWSNTDIERKMPLPRCRLQWTVHCKRSAKLLLIHLCWSGWTRLSQFLCFWEFLHCDYSSSIPVYSFDYIHWGKSEEFRECVSVANLASCDSVVASSWTCFNSLLHLGSILVFSRVYKISHVPTG